MKTLRLFLSLMLIGLFVSCTDNDKPLDLTSLLLEYDSGSTNIPVNKVVGFSLKGDDFIDYTQQMTLHINGQSVSGNVYTFTDSGEFEISASIGNVGSNTIVFTVSEGMIISHTSLLRNQVNNFTLYDVSTGDEVSDQAVFYVNGTATAGSSFSSAETGSFEVYAEYTDDSGETLVTDAQSFRVVAPVQRVLIEDYTGTWCGYCPRLQGAISKVMQLTDYAVPIALHKSSGDANPDPYEYEFIGDLVSAYNPFGEFPLGVLNRTIYWTDNNPETPLGYIGGESSIGIAATTRVSGSQLNIDVRVVSTSSLTNRKIVVAAVENGLVHSQANYLNNDPNSEWYQMGNPIPEYENNHVLRHAMTNIFGDAIPSTDALKDFKKSYTMNLDNYFNNNENGDVVVFVLDDEGNVLQVKMIGFNVKSELD